VDTKTSNTKNQNRMKRLSLIVLGLGTLLISSCGEHTDVVESGTYKGKIEEVEADKTEIYVKTPDGKLLELYFTTATKLTRDTTTVDFKELKEGGEVEVTVEKKGNRLDPVAVKILK
jgi:CspA family cold shock protein